MWREKLTRFSKVQRQGGCKACGHGGRFFIELRLQPALYYVANETVQNRSMVGLLRLSGRPLRVLVYGVLL